MAKLLPYKGNYYLWHYLPSIPGAAAFSIVFLILTILQIRKAHKTKSHFCIPFVIGCGFEAIGYACRIPAHHRTNSLMLFILQSVFILVAPALFAATIYMTLSRLIRFLQADHLSPVRITWLTKVFLIGDILSFMIQGNSASLTFKASTAKIGEALIVAGLFVQITSFGLFFLTSLVFHYRVRDKPTNMALTTEVEWRRVLYMLYLVSVLILLRSIFRVVEYLMGYQGYLFVNEWPLYVFDAVPMWVVCVAFWWCWPSELRVVKGEQDAGVELTRMRRVRRWLRLS